MPNYVAYLDKNPEQKALLTHEDENGDLRYYEIGCIVEENSVPWAATPTAGTGSWNTPSRPLMCGTGIATM